ncbi:MAG: LexA family transcriptional regulator [Clostridia bacterium]|nr:LexA family transcriptional regulator [Clostridia bacterium]MBR2908351.1 LexA family transcriptional regulator [Clostridia bacterium]
MFKEQFVKLCNEKGVAPTVVCQEIGLSAAAFSKWTDESIPRAATLQKLADYFHVSVPYLRGETQFRHTLDLQLFAERTEPAPPRTRGVKIPVFGSVAAGIPIEAITDIEDYEEISEDLAATGEFVALKIKGDSMEPTLLAGDVVIVRVQDTIENGEIAIVLVNGDEATCKKIKKTPEGVMLISLNAAYDPMFYTNAEIESLPVRIFGKVVEMRRAF